MKPIEEKLDILWSQAVKAKDHYRCVLCKGPGHESHHLIKRGHKSLRWDIINGVTLCTAHHALVTDGHIKLQISEALDKAKKIVVKYTREELEEIERRLKAFIRTREEYAGNTRPNLGREDLHK